MSNKKKNIKTIIAVAVLLVLVIGAFTAWKLLSPKPRDRHPEPTAEVTAAAEKQAAPAETPAPEPEAKEEAQAPAEAEIGTTDAAELAEPAEEAAAEPTEETAAEPEAVAEAPAGAEEDLVTIGVSVTHKDGSVKEFSISTPGLTLREALEQEGLIAGDESEYGLYVKTVDGETVNDAEQERWCINSNGEMLMTGVDSTYIADGDHYEFVFTVGW